MHWPHFRIFDNRQMDALYATTALFQFGISFISIFVPIYLWELGYAIWQILLFYALISAVFVLVTRVVLPVLRHMNDRTMVLAAIPFVVLYFFGLRALPTMPMLLFALPFANVVYRLLYNTGIHADMTQSMDDGHIGREVAARRMVSYAMRFVAPLLGGFIIAGFGFGNAFIVASVVLAFAALPLFFVEPTRLSRSITWSQMKEQWTSPELRPFNISAVGFASMVMVGRIVWPLFIFLIIGSIAEFGTIVAFGLLASGIVSYLAGSMTDHGKRRTTLTWSTFLFTGVWLARTLVGQVPAAVAGQVGGDVSYGLVSTAWSSQYYKLARATKHPGAFIIAREVLYHMARVVFLPILAGLSLLMAFGLFAKASFVIAAGLTLLYLFANREHTAAVASSTFGSDDNE